MAPAFLPHAQPLQRDVFAPRPASALGNNRFAVIGDAGTGDSRQHAVAQWMLDAWHSRPFASVLVLGDNVYDRGEPERFEAAIARPYKGLLERGIRFFPVIGNHDDNAGYGEAQMAYWGIPGARWYQTTLAGGQVELFALDTTLLLPGYAACHTNRQDWARQMADAQLRWLDEGLARSTARYRIVMGHYPIHSSGMHANTPLMVERMERLLAPLLAGRADVYLAGHEHHYERSAPVNGVTHIVSGAGGGRIRPLLPWPTPRVPREAAAARRHFVLFEVTDAGLVFQAIGRNGKVLDAGLIPPNPERAAVATGHIAWA